MYHIKYNNFIYIYLSCKLKVKRKVKGVFIMQYEFIQGIIVIIDLFISLLLV